VYERLPGGGRLDLLPAGNREEQAQLDRYVLAVRTFDWQDFFFNWEGELFFEWLRSSLVPERYDLVLVDSRTGVTEMGGICAYQLGDVIVMMCGANKQNMRGTQEVMADFLSPRVLALRRDRPPRLVIVPARIEQRDPTLLEAFIAEFTAKFGMYLPQELECAGIGYAELMVPYEPQYAFEERVVSDPHEVATRQRISTAFERLVNAITMLAPPQSALVQLASAADSNAAIASGQTQYDPAAKFATYDVYLFASAVDRQHVEPLERRLTSTGLRVFADLVEVVPGSEWQRRCDLVLVHSKACVIAVATSLSQSQAEALRAALYAARTTRELVIIPVQLSAEAHLPETVWKQFDAVQPVSLAGWLEDERGIEALLGRLTELLVLARPEPLSVDAFAVHPLGTTPDGAEARAPRGATAEVARGNPFRGLEPFAEEHAAVFFGRERLVERLRTAVSDYRQVWLVGPSASGKTSAILAGVFPALRSQQQFRTLHYCVPEHGGAVALADTLAHLERDGTQPQHLLCVDALERIIRADIAQEERQAFCTLLARLPTERPDVVTLLVVREDSVQALAATPLPVWQKATGAAVVEKVPLLAPKELRDIIEKPAERAGLAYEPGLVDRIVHDAGTDASLLPIVQLLLSHLWDKRREGWFTNTAYEEIGGIRALVITLARMTLEVLPVSAPQALTILARLVQLGDTAEDSRRRALRQELVKDEGPTVHAMVDQLIESRILVACASPTDEPCVELVHSSLATDCSELRNFIVADRDFLLWRQGLNTYRADWEKNNYDGRALLSGRLYRTAREWLEKRRRDLNAAECAYIERSAQHERRIRMVKLLGAAVLLLSVGGVITWEQRQKAAIDAAQQQAKQADRAVERGAYEEALRLYSAALERYPDRAVLLLKRAQVYDAQHELSKAIEDYTRVLQENPQATDAYLLRGSAQLASGALTAAAADYTRAIELAPDEAKAKAYYSRGVVHDRMNQAREAIADFTEALRRNPEYVAALFARGQLYQQLGQPEEAVRDFEQVLKVPSVQGDQDAARKRLTELGADSKIVRSKKATVYLRVSDDTDRATAAGVLKELNSSQAFEVPGVEEVSGTKTLGDVRFVPGDEKLATEVRSAVELALAKQGYRTRLELLQLDPKQFPTAARGMIEVWLPPLARASLGRDVRQYK
jgi:tetratricopeptide (TPR) repeat protein